ncbi:MAG: type II toxin-antitoxin system VapC family toxin [Natronosporangium sp.]
MTTGLLDTSVFIAREVDRPLDVAALPDESGVSVVTIAELRLGVLQAADDATRSRRLNTLAAAQRLAPLPVDEQVAAAWALLRRQLRLAGLRMEVNDSWIAATAIAHGLAVVTQDQGFPETVPNLAVIRV